MSAVDMKNGGVWVCGMCGFPRYSVFLEKCYVCPGKLKFVPFQKPNEVI